jgi:hypothetical protein
VPDDEEDDEDFRGSGDGSSDGSSSDGSSNDGSSGDTSSDDDGSSSGDGVANVEIIEV